MKYIEVEGVKELKAFYVELEAKISIARKSCSFHCFEGCGACCYSPSKNLEVTLFEAIPMAQAIIESGEHEAVLASLEEGDCAERPCLFYVKNSPDGKMGACTNYQTRPHICRLFGSSVKNMSTESRVPIVCKELKALHFDDVAKLTKLRNLLPIAGQTSAKARAFNPILSSELLPLNEAVKRALYYLLMRMDYSK